MNSSDYNTSDYNTSEDESNFQKLDKPKRLERLKRRIQSGRQVLTQYKYIHQETEQHIKDFRYKGSTSSILYEYLWSPLCNRLVELLPETIAPNSITIFAFFWVVVSHINLVYHSPDFQQEVPAWCLIFNGFTTLAYQILDNMDGKQARRTQSSTPLGMLFDHGLDSVTSWIFGINQLICFGNGVSGLSMITLVLSAYIGFYTAQWSQYHTGVLEMGRVNAVDEGLVLVEFLFFFTSIKGVKFWSNTIFGFKYNDLALFGLLAMTIAENIGFLVMTFKAKTGRRKRQKVRTLEQTWLLLITIILYIIFTPIEYFNGFHTYLFLVSFGLMWSKSTIHLQIAHLGKQTNYFQWRISFLIACLSHIFNTVYMFFNEKGDRYVQLHVLIYIVLFYAFVIFFHTAINVTRQMAKLLEINVFSLEYKKKQIAELQKEDKKNQ